MRSCQAATLRRYAARVAASSVSGSRWPVSASSSSIGPASSGRSSRRSRRCSTSTCQRGGGSARSPSVQPLRRQQIRADHQQPAARVAPRIRAKRAPPARSAGPAGRRSMKRSSSISRPLPCAGPNAGSGAAPNGTTLQPIIVRQRQVAQRRRQPLGRAQLGRARPQAIERETSSSTCTLTLCSTSPSLTTHLLLVRVGVPVDIAVSRRRRCRAGGR